MPSIAELLAAANVKDEVIKGLPAEVVTVIEGHLTSAANSLTEANRLKALADQGQKEIDEYVVKYGEDLNALASARAQVAGYEAALGKLKADGINIPVFPSPAGGQPVVPGSPAMGGNAPVDANQIFRTSAAFAAQGIDASNEYLRLFGSPMPDTIESLATEAQANRMTPAKWAEHKYKFAEKRETKSKEEEQKKLDSYATQKVEEDRRKRAEASGSNPNLVQGGTSRNSVVRKVNPEDFHKADGFQTARERKTRLLQNIHRDVEAARSA